MLERCVFFYMTRLPHFQMVTERKEMFIHKNTQLYYFPITSASLYQQIQRGTFQGAIMWGQALIQNELCKCPCKKKCSGHCSCKKLTCFCTPMCPCPCPCISDE